MRWHSHTVNAVAKSQFIVTKIQISQCYLLLVSDIDEGLRN